MAFYDDADDGQGQRQHQGDRQHNQPLHTEKIFTDRKVFFMDLKENSRGRVVKITEDVKGRRDTIMVPIEALNEFLDALQRIDDYDRENPGEYQPEEGSAED